jgi:hypothetical protein
MAVADLPIFERYLLERLSEDDPLLKPVHGQTLDALAGKGLVAVGPRGRDGEIAYASLTDAGRDLLKTLKGEPCG